MAVQAGVAYVDVVAGSTKKLVAGATHGGHAAGQQASRAIRSEINDGASETGQSFAARFVPAAQEGVNRRLSGLVTTLRTLSGAADESRASMTQLARAATGLSGPFTAVQRVMGRTTGRITGQIPVVGRLLSRVQRLGAVGANAMLTFGSAAAAAGGAVAAAVAGLPVLIAGIGIKFAAETQAVKSAFTGLADHMKSTMRSAVQPLVPVLTQFAGQARQVFNSLTPVIERTFANLAPALATVGQEMLAAVDAFRPALSAIANTAGPILSNIAGMFDQIAAGAASALRPMLRAVAQAGPLFASLGTFVARLLPTIGQLLASFVNLANRVLPVLLPVLQQIITAVAGALMGALRAATPAIVAVVRAFGQIVTALSPLLALLPALIRAVAPVVTAFARLAAQFVTTLIRGIRPFLPMLIRLAVTIGRMLGRALRQVMPALGAILRAILSLLPAVLPLLPALARLFGAVIRLIAPVLRLAAGIVVRLMPFLRPLIGLVVRVATVLLTVLTTAVRIVGWALRGLADAGRWMWNVVLRPVFTAIVRVWRSVIAPAARWLWRRVIRPVFTGIGTTIRFVWRRIIRPAFDAVKSAVNTVGDVFRRVVDGIGRVWGRLKNIAKKPVNFIIGTVYNNGIRRLWNLVNNLWGGNDLNRLPTLARGGVYPGYTPGRDVGLAAVSGGEAIMRPEWTKAMGREYVDAANAAARSGGVTGARRFAGGFASGGIADFFSSAWNWATDKASFVADIFTNPARTLIRAADPILDRLENIPFADTGFARGLARIPRAMLEKLAGAVPEGGSFGAGLAWARSKDNMPYQWGGVGNPSYDCSGFISAITNVIMGRPPNRRLFTTASFAGGGGAGGFRSGVASPFMIGVTPGSHMAGTLLGVDVESSGSYGVQVGGPARGATHPMFSYRFGFAGAGRGGGRDQRGAEGANADRGGVLPHGGIAVNTSGLPEAVLTHRQWHALEALASSSGSDGGGAVGAGAPPVTVNLYGATEPGEVVRRLNFELRRARMAGAWSG